MARRTAEARLRLMEMRIKKLKKEIEMKKSRAEIVDLRQKIKTMM